jgi:hypothetical protein
MSEQVEWTGNSGASYTFVVIPWPAPLDEGYVVGNYICARRTGHGDWVPVYIGEGDLGSPCSRTHPCFDQLRKRGVTHMHCHLNNDADARRHEARDLQLSHPLAVVPVGCDEPVGGDGAAGDTRTA